MDTTVEAAGYEVVPIRKRKSEGVDGVCVAGEFGDGFEGGTFGGRVSLIGGGEDARGRIGGEDEDLVVAAAGGYQGRVERMLGYAEDRVCVEIEVRY